MNVSIIGESGGLANGLINTLSATHNVTSYSKDRFNFLHKDNVCKLADQICNSDIIICCAGVFDNVDTWDMYLINSVAPQFLLEQLSKKESKAHFIMMGSHSASWTSWPDASITRISYNNSKKSIQQFIESLAHSQSSGMKLTVVNLSKFQTKMSNYHGHAVSDIANTIENILDSKIPIILYELH